MTILRLAKRVPPLPGGQERHILELTCEQAAAHHRVILLYADGDLRGGTGWSAHRLPTPSMTSGVLTSLLFAVQAIRWVLVQRPKIDLIHAHGDFAEALPALILARWLRCRAVLTCHASFTPGPGMYALLRRAIFNRLDHIFCVSGHTAQAMRQIGTRVPITTQHSGTRLARLRALGGGRAEQPMVVAVGRLVPLKGFEYLIEATRLLAKEWPDLQVCIAGDGPLGEALRAASADVPQVRFMGQLERDEVYRLLGQAWVFCQASVNLPNFTEGLPTTAIEAMAAGLPVVGTDVAGLPEVVTDNVNGLLVPPADAAALAGALGRLLREPDLCQTMAQANRVRASSFDWSQVAQVFTTVCEELVDGSRALTAAAD